MGASQSTAKADRTISVKLNNALTAGITKVDGSKAISEQISISVANREVTAYLRVNGLSAASASLAALAFGEHVFSYPSGIGLIQPLFTSVKLTSTTGAGQAATAGEVGMGTVVASGAVAVLGGTATFENIMEGTTLSNHVAATALTSKKGNYSVAYGDHGAAGVAGVLDATAADVKAFLNIATTYANASTAATTFSATIVHRFRVLGTDFGVL